MYCTFDLEVLSRHEYLEDVVSSQERVAVPAKVQHPIVDVGKRLLRYALL